MGGGGGGSEGSRGCWPCGRLKTIFFVFLCCLTGSLLKDALARVSGSPVDENVPPEDVLFAAASAPRAELLDAEDATETSNDAEDDEAGGDSIHSSKADARHRRDEEVVLHAASVYPDSSGGHRSLYPAMASICQSATEEGLKVHFHLLLVESESASVHKLQQHMEKEWPCEVSTYVMREGRYKWKSVVKPVDGQRFVPGWPDYWRSIMLPAEMGRHGVELALIFAGEVLVLSSGLLGQTVKSCRSWLRKNPQGLACLPQRASWREGAYIANASAFSARKLDDRLYDIASQLAPGFSMASLFRRLNMDDDGEVFSHAPLSCRAAGLNARDPFRSDFRTSDLLECDQGIVHFAPAHLPWRKPRPLQGPCVRHGQCDEFALCMWWHYHDGLPATVAATTDSFMHVQGSLAAATAWNDPVVDAGVAGPKCDLSWMKDKLHLFTMVPSTDYDLMEHFLQHYAALGINLKTRCKVIIHDRGEGTLESMMRILRRAGVDRTKVVSNYTSSIKLQHVNAFMGGLPKDAWLIYPDTDEFFEFPCTLRKLIAEGTTEFFGEMMERVGPGLTLPLLKSKPSILEQYPVSCPYRRKLMKGGWASKYMLLKVWSPETSSKSRKFTDSHRLSNVNVVKKGWGAGKFLGAFPHLYFVGNGACDKLAFKQSIYQSGIRGLIYRKGGELIDCSSGVPKFADDAMDKLHDVCEVQEECQ